MNRPFSEDQSIGKYYKNYNYIYLGRKINDEEKYVKINKLF